MDTAISASRVRTFKLDDNDDNDDDISHLALRRKQQRLDLDSSLDSSLWTDSPAPRFKEGKKYEPKGFIAELKIGGSRVHASTTLMPPLFDDEVRLTRINVPPVVKCECNGVECRALLNSSSTVSLISKEFVNKIRAAEDILPTLTPVANPLHTPMPSIEGRLKYVELSIGSYQQVMQLYVVLDSQVELCLGVDFLRKIQGTLNFQDCCLYLGGSKGEKVTFLNTKEVLMKNKQEKTLTFS